MPKPVCVKCKRFFKPIKNGAYWEEGMPVDTGPAAQWQSYKLWVGDLHECRGCGAQIVVGHGSSPIAEHFEPDYAETCQRLESKLRVDDC